MSSIFATGPTINPVDPGGHGSGSPGLPSGAPPADGGPVVVVKPSASVQTWAPGPQKAPSGIVIRLERIPDGKDKGKVRFSTRWEEFTAEKPPSLGTVKGSIDVPVYLDVLGDVRPEEYRGFDWQRAALELLGPTLEQLLEPQPLPVAPAVDRSAPVGSLNNPVDVSRDWHTDADGRRYNTGGT